MTKGLNPRQDINGRNQPEKPAKYEAERKQDVIATYIGRAFRRHPLLLGLLIGYILRHLFTGGFGLG